jgi:hypothetical protein
MVHISNNQYNYFLNAKYWSQIQIRKDYSGSFLAKSSGLDRIGLSLKPVLRIRIRSRKFLDLLDPDPDPLVRGMDSDPSIIKQKL